MNRIKACRNLIMITLSVTATGCDERSVRLAREAADRQALQNTAMTELNREVATRSRRLVAADAQARREMVAVQKDLQAERSRLDAGWTELNAERRNLAAERRAESILTPAIQVAGGLALVVVLLGFCWRALVSSATTKLSDEELSQVLLDEFFADDANFSSEKSALPNLAQSRDRLPTSA